MNKILFTLLSLSVAAIASTDAHVDSGATDIVERTVNFLIFVGVVYYLIAEPVKEFFTGRSKGIADEQNKVKEKLEESKKAKELAKLEIDAANKFAQELEVTAKKENKIVNDNIMTQCDSDLQNLENQNGILMDFDQRAMTREVVETVMNDVMTQENENFGKEAMAQIVMKKVA